MKIEKKGRHFLSMLISLAILSEYSMGADYDNQIPANTLETIHIQAKYIFPEDKNSKWFIEEYLKKVYVEVKYFSVKDLPPNIMNQIKLLAQTENPDNYIEQLNTIVSETVNYFLLIRYSSDIIPYKALQKIKEKARNAYPDDYAWQLFKVKSQAADYLKLKHYTVHDIPTNILGKIKTTAKEEYLEDYSQQLSQVKSEAADYLKLKHYTVHDIPTKILAKIKISAKGKYPDDYGR
ncbi:MAG: hypothetical protein KAH72_11950, partial [Flavobacteriaceae bacterium]|nr:hypothetical protein [Flavobacteriaceae bacterium]